MFNSGYFYLVLVYLCWGTTFLAMRVGVGPEGGFPALAFGAMRCLAAGLVLLGLAKLRGQSIRVDGKQLRYLAFTGVLGWVVAHGLLLLAEKHVDSGFAAIAGSASPLWVLLIASLLDRSWPRPAHAALVLVGFCGVAALIVPALRHAPAGNLITAVPLLLSAVSWAYVTIYMQRHAAPLPVFTTSGYQHLFGAAGFLVLSLVSREPLPQPNAAALGAMAYLVVFGSVVGYTSFIKALSLLPVHVVTTNTYVNPVIAVIVGWLVLREAVTPWMILAMGLVTLSVAGILRLNQRQAGQPAAARAAAVAEE